MSTRRMGGARIDHGAQFAQRDPYGELLSLWKNENAVEPCKDHLLGGLIFQQIRGIEAQRAHFGKSLAKEFSVEQLFVDQIERRS